MISYFCNVESSVKNLFLLLHKIYKHEESILVITNNEEEQDTLSDLLWRFRNFLPHGTKNDKYLEDQPIVISNEVIDKKFDIHMYYNSAEYSNHLKTILWNPQITIDVAKKLGKVWKYDSKWELISSDN